ncbi:MAG: hypothetical protein LH467_15265 [Gemmatimonadaceae bacterium]|nr:hypothetical protein [Gemmatimonadaceae bacterium]
MIALFWQALPSVREAASSGIWPVTIAGWFTLAAVMGGAVTFFIDRGKQEQKINDWGARVNMFGDDLKRIEGVQLEHAKLMAGIVSDQVRITQELGRSERAAEECGDNATKHSIEIGVKVDNMRLSIEGKISAFGERMAGVERELELGRQMRFNQPSRGQSG